MTEADELTRRLSSAGWSVTTLREKALVVGDVPKDVTRGTATKAGLHATFERIGETAGDETLRLLGPLGRLTAVRRVGAVVFRAEVRVSLRAMTELTHLAGPVLDAKSFAAALEAVEARGFAVDRDASLEDTYDTFVWEIRAYRPGEHLDLGAHFASHGLALHEGAFTDDHGDAELRRPGAVLYVRVTSLTAAEQLLDVLTRGS
jgi:hypothetical protein